MGVKEVELAMKEGYDLFGGKIYLAFVKGWVWGSGIGLATT